MLFYPLGIMEVSVSSDDLVNTKKFCGQDSTRKTCLLSLNAVTQGLEEIRSREETKGLPGSS